MADVMKIISQLPVVDLEEGPPQRPMIATVREIDAEVKNDKISFFFSKGTYRVDLLTYPGGFEGLLRDVRTGSFAYVNRTTNRPDPPETPLSLNNQDLSFIVYKLTPKNWQFCSKYPPFTISEELKELNIYFEARRITATGDKQKVEIKKDNPDVDKCMVAYFIADGRKATGFTGSYIHALNIHVDLVYDETEIARVPIIIDPDVRHPGGSGE